MEGMNVNNQQNTQGDGNTRTLSAQHLELVEKFQTSLKEKLEKLELNDTRHFNMEWMQSAMKTVSETERGCEEIVRSLDPSYITWDKDQVSEFLDDSQNLGEICFALSNLEKLFAKTKMSLGHAMVFLLRTTRVSIDAHLICSKKSIELFMDHVKGKFSRGLIEQYPRRIEKMFETMKSFKVEERPLGPKEAVADIMYATKAITTLTTHALVSAFMGCGKQIDNFKVADKFVWAEPYMKILNGINAEMSGWAANGAWIGFEEVANLEKAANALHAYVERQIPVNDFGNQMWVHFNELYRMWAVFVPAYNSYHVEFEELYKIFRMKLYGWVQDVQNKVLDRWFQMEASDDEEEEEEEEIDELVNLVFRTVFR